MTTILTQQQRQFAQYVLMFERFVFGQSLPYEMAQNELALAFQRATLGCAENKLEQTGFKEFFCGLYLQYRDQMELYFSGDLYTLVQRTFAKHRFGEAGLMPEPMPASEGFGYSIDLADNLLRLLWLATRLSNAVGEKADLKTVVAAIAQDVECLGELERNGIRFKQELSDFNQVLNVVFFATYNAMLNQERTVSFDLDDQFRPPFTAVVKTPSGPGEPMKRARLKLNNQQIADISWPENPMTRVPVELQEHNLVEFEFDLPDFGGMEVVIRGNRR
ncbi:MAG TPA: hypothetical protein VG759_10920 [Candidatus Angelobacter sp.]|jgi:hypothetical protein|nr:hypothetical protein [Candidatus Angelobacter sp.]